ncbi:MAG: Actin-like protein arp9 (SWI/SNF complex component arp9) [Watsoniomyces obsoletus]|nr:MAG: Actin-like protein arp9 (SWI/SNF complex component arp9) [Watsoniomyces obsoletus]
MASSTPSVISEDPIESESDHQQPNRVASPLSRLRALTGVEPFTDEMPAFKDEHLLIIAPGSQTTLAQLGLPESLTPARHRFPTRMFLPPAGSGWEPHKVREKRVPKPTSNGTTGDVATGAHKKSDEANGDVEEFEIEYEEDTESDEGAVYPIQQGRVRNWPCFLALLTHIHNTLSPPFHTPILLITQPAWTSQDHEMATQFCFEKFRTPAFALMDAALAVCYAYGTSLATVIDVGYDKCDVTAVVEFLVHDVGRGVAIQNCGGEAMTQRLLELLKPQGWTRDMCEQLKRSAICEILPQGEPLPGRPESSHSASPAAMNAPRSQRGSVAEGARIGLTSTGAELGVESNDGVLDVASLVVSGKTTEFLAKKEREKAERAAKKAGAAAEAAAALNKPAKLPNSKREKNTFVYEGRHFMEKGSDTDGQAVDQNGTNGSGEQNTNGGGETSGDQPELVKREVEVGIERFRAADNGIIETIADTVHRTVLAVEEVNQRAELWESLIIVGNGSKVRGFKEALLSTLTAKHLISPSSATIFTSELPSQLSTPLATGANTPQIQPQSSMNPSSSVNPLLLAATTASNPALQQHPPTNASTPPSMTNNSPHHHHHQVHSSHGQTPTSIKFLKPPEYFPEWKEVGYEEAVFLGAQVAAKVVFVVDQGLSKGFMTRAEYNELGPQGIHDCAL